VYSSAAGTWFSMRCASASLNLWASAAVLLQHVELAYTERGALGIAELRPCVDLLGCQAGASGLSSNAIVLMATLHADMPPFCPCLAFRGDLPGHLSTRPSVHPAPHRQCCKVMCNDLPSSSMQIACELPCIPGQFVAPVKILQPCSCTAAWGFGCSASRDAVLSCSKNARVYAVLGMPCCTRAFGCMCRGCSQVLNGQ
jgi:hypothetical protein